jgi:hypothetical protein
MAFGLKFREQLTGAIRDEFEQLVASLNGWSRTEHNGDGSHSDISADSVTLQGAPVGTLIDLPYDATRFFAEPSAVWTVQAGDLDYLKATRIGQIVTVWFRVQNTAITVDAAQDLQIRLPELHAIPVVGVAGSLTQVWGCGMVRWIDGGNLTNGIAFVDAQAGGQETYLSLARIDPTTGESTTWPTTSDLDLYGSICFPVEPNNVATEYVVA